MNREDAKNILLPYRHGSADADDPEIAEALALAKFDAELGRWLEQHCARQFVLREKFRQIPVPDGLREQIISEQSASERRSPLAHNRPLFATLVVTIILFVYATFIWDPESQSDNSLENYQAQMAHIALSAYSMDFATNDVVSIREHLHQNQAPADFRLTEPLQHTALTGCAVRDWQSEKISLVCFHSGEHTASADTSDLWLFVVDRKLVKDAPDNPKPVFFNAKRMLFAVWIQGDKLYLLGKQGDVQSLARFL